MVAEIMMDSGSLSSINECGKNFLEKKTVKKICAAICDDEKKICEIYQEKIKNLSEKLEVSFEIEIFWEETEFLQELFLEKFDLVFLDIDMPHISGMEIAKRMMELEEKPLLVFITNRNELVYQTFEYQPLGFLRKSFFDEEIEAVLRRAVQKIAEAESRYVFKNGNQLTQVKISDIFYFEADKNYVYLYTRQEKYHFRGTLSAVEEALCGHHFIRIHKGFFVNQEAVFQLGADCVKLENGVVLPIGRTNREEVRKRLMRYFLR